MSATGRGAIRREADFYPTPADATRSLAANCDPVIARNMTWGEPCVGDGAIISAFAPALGVRSSWEWCEIREGRDYLKTGMPGVQGIVTNPPFSLAQEFIDRTLNDRPLFAAYLLRLNFLGSRKRMPWWSAGRIPTHLLVLSQRPSFTGKGTDATEYAWFCWDNVGLMKRPPGVHVI